MVLPQLAPFREGPVLVGEVIHVDAFGTLITSIESAAVPAGGAAGRGTRERGAGGAPRLPAGRAARLVWPRLPGVGPGYHAPTLPGFP